MDSITTYIRLLQYEEAVAFMQYINKGEEYPYANITAGGIRFITNTEDQFVDGVSWLESNANRYELSKNHPMVTHDIIRNRFSK